MHLLSMRPSVFGGALLIAATTIGVGMLALPIATGLGGFFPAILIYLVCWAFMLCTGLLFLEVCLWLPKDANLISMAHRLLGKTGQVACWVIYLFLFSTVMIAHVAGGGEIVQEIFGFSSPVIPSILYVLLFAPVVYLGTAFVNKLNLILFSGVIFTYLLFIGFSYKFVNLSFLANMDFGKSILALPVLFTAFTYQVIIPTLTTYLNRDVKKIRQAIFIGTSIPLVIYIIWEMLILSIVPPEAIVTAYSLGQNAVQPLKKVTNNSALFQIGKGFAFFTLTASYITLAIAFVDFLADGLKMEKKGWGKIVLCALVFIPPLIITLIHPNLFLIALSYAGGYGCAILFGVFPPLMVWIGRYRKATHLFHKEQLGGGKILLIFLFIFVAAELLIQILGPCLHALC